MGGGVVAKFPETVLRKKRKIVSIAIDKLTHDGEFSAWIESVKSSATTETVYVTTKKGRIVRISMHARAMNGTFHASYSAYNILKMRREKVLEILGAK